MLGFQTSNLFSRQTFRGVQSALVNRCKWRHNHVTLKTQKLKSSPTSYSNFIYFYIDLFCYQQWAHTRMILLHFWILKENLGEQDFFMTDTDGFYLHISNWYKHRALNIIPFPNRHNLHLKNIAYFDWFCWL